MCTVANVRPYGMCVRSTVNRHREACVCVRHTHYMLCMARIHAYTRALYLHQQGGVKFEQKRLLLWLSDERPQAKPKIVTATMDVCEQMCMIGGRRLVCGATCPVYLSIYKSNKVKSVAPVSEARGNEDMNSRRGDPIIKKFIVLSFSFVVFIVFTYYYTHREPEHGIHSTLAHTHTHARARVRSQE